MPQVNIGALLLCTIGAVYIQRAPFSATQLLWLNILMDSCASLALATEPPTDAQLQRPPVNRSDHIITKRMWFNMLSQAIYQVVIVLVLMFWGQRLAHHELKVAGVENGQDYLKKTGNYSRQYTIIFNTYVMMQLFNEINCRMLNGELNVFSGISRNKYFVGIWLTTIGLQCLFTNIGGPVVGCSSKGLTAGQWAVCMILGAGVIPWQLFVNVVSRTFSCVCGQYFSNYTDSKVSRARAGHFR